MVRYWTPSSIAARTVRRTASTPLRCPAERGSPCRSAHRPLPSIMIATWRGTGALSRQAEVWLCSFIKQAPPGNARQRQPSSEAAEVQVGGRLQHGLRSYLLDLDFLAGQYLIDLFDQPVGQLLHLGGVLMVVVLAHLAVLVELLEQVHALAPHIAHGYARVLGVLVRDLDQLLASLGVQRGDRQAHQGALDDWVEP